MCAEARFIGLSDSPPARVTSPVKPVVRGTLQRTGTSASEHGADQFSTSNEKTENQEQARKTEVTPESVVSKEECPNQDEGPGLAATAGGVASKALNVAGRFALAAAVVIDSYRSVKSHAAKYIFKL